MNDLYFLENREKIFWEEKNNRKSIKKILSLDWDYVRRRLREIRNSRKNIK